MLHSPLSRHLTASNELKKPVVLSIECVTESINQSPSIPNLKLERLNFASAESHGSPGNSIETLSSLRLDESSADCAAALALFSSR